MAAQIFHARFAMGDRLDIETDVVRRFGDASDPALRVELAKALVYKAVTLGKLRRSEEALAVCDEVVRRFGEAADARLLAHVANALYNKGVAFDALERRVASLEKKIDQLSKPAKPAARKTAAKPKPKPKS